LAIEIGAQGLWDSLPPVYLQYAVLFTDFWKAYDKVFPNKRHKSVGEETGLTNRIERFNCTMRQRINLTFVRYLVARLVRSTLSFSKKLSNHIGAIWIFIFILHFDYKLFLSFLILFIYIFVILSVTSVKLI